MEFFLLDLVKNTDLMIKQSVWTSVIAADLSSKYLAEGGALVLTGAQAALSGTPGRCPRKDMIQYPTTHTGGGVDINILF